ncbi:MAG: hypothetical protein LBM73_00880 [Candidatus Nomurabacteria bacterium]|nr:hypothetical protein [Candidatus Nomurabacteria bacterium]
MKIRDGQRGANALIVPLVVAAILAVGLGAGFFWAFGRMNDYKNNSDQKVSAAVSAAKSDQQKSDNATFTEKYKQPFDVYQSSADYGSVKFNYPRTWSVYTGDDGTGSGSSGVASYLYPGVVPPLNGGNDKTIYALEVQIQNKSYKDVLQSYDNDVKSGKLSASPLALRNGGFSADGMKISGKFSDTITGIAVVFKIRDKTLILRSDQSDFFNDFNNTILPSLTFTP